MVPKRNIVVRTAISDEVDLICSNPEAYVHQLLSSATNQKQRAQLLVKMQQDHGEFSQVNNEVITIVQTIIEQEESWRYMNINRSTFLELIDYENIVQPAMESHRRTNERRTAYERKILKNWSEDWRSKMKGVQPRNPEKMLGHISRISQLVSAEVARKYLQTAIQHRLTNWRQGQRTTKLATTMDLLFVEKTIKKLAADTAFTQAVNIAIKAGTAVGTVVDAIAAESALPTESVLGMEMAANMSSLQPEDSDEDSPLANRMRMWIDDGTGNGVNNEAHEAELKWTDDGMDSENEARNQIVKIYEYEEDDEEKDEEEEEQPTQIMSFRSCTCGNKSVVQARLLAAKKRGFHFLDRTTLMKDLEYLTPATVNSTCWPHVRNFAAAVGLKTSKKKLQLIKRIDHFRNQRFRLGHMLVDPRYRSWFLKPLRGMSPEAVELGTLRLAPIPVVPFVFNKEVVLRRFMGDTAYNNWMKYGTVVVKGAYDWLFMDVELIQLVRHEFQMYQHHRRKMNNQGSLGWLRSAYFTQIQQIARQDPGYYALLAATSGNWWQISFPYYLKATLPGDGVSFEHVDLNLPRYLECGRGQNRVQSSLTLTQEHAENCNGIVPGFHRHIHDWWSAVCLRAEKGGEGVKRANIARHSTNCLKTNDLFLPEDKKKYGDFVPAICDPGDIRVSRSEILHASLGNKKGKCSTVRWVVNPWFVGIQPDHETTDIMEAGTWSQLSAYHRDFTACDNTPSGQLNLHGSPVKRFPASLPLRHISHLSDALIGQAR